MGHVSYKWLYYPCAATTREANRYAELGDGRMTIRRGRRRWDEMGGTMDREGWIYATFETLAFSS